jgi:uncharacterized protein (TIGR02757 family)
MHLSELSDLLNKKYIQYNKPSFIPQDPIVVPHQFSKQQDIEIAGFFAATLAWGLRKTIINNTRQLMLLMDNDPHNFVLHYKETDLKPFLHFVHRTFNATDLLYFLHFLQYHYQQHTSLEDAFLAPNSSGNLEAKLKYFYNTFFSLDHPERTHKHVATPARNSACKRLCMYLRWMVRKDKNGVDFGIWHKIKSSELICPLDVHVSHIAYKLQLIPHQKSDWKTALILTENLRTLDAKDPSKYDYALFGLGAEEKGLF